MAKKKSEAKHPAGSDMARKIWLAGIGAYGRAFSEAQESIAKMSDETSKYFEDLVSRGEEIENEVETRGREIAQKVKSSPAFSMDDRIKEMRDRLKRSGGLGAGVLSGDHDRMDALEARLDAIEEKLDAVLAGKTAKKKTTKKKTTQKKAARKASS